MNQEIYLLKKKQRIEQTKKRSLIDTSVLSNNFYYKKLTKYDWFNEGKIIASFLSIKSEALVKTQVRDTLVRNSLSA